MREYFKDWSHALGRDMEVLRFGSNGLPLLVFPTSMGRFYQWEDFGLVGALLDKIEAGYIQLWCVDSIDGESWYANDTSPPERVARHLQYERYLVDELMPRIPGRPVTTGTSFGAFHALLLALRQPDRVNGFIGLSGAYDAARWLDGQSDGEAYYVNPVASSPDCPTRPTWGRSGPWRRRSSPPAGTTRTWRSRPGARSCCRTRALTCGSTCGTDGPTTGRTGRR